DVTTEGALGASARAGKVRRPRARDDVNVTRRWCDRERLGSFVIAAAQVGRLLERCQVAVQARDERVFPRTPTEGVLGTTCRSREIGGVRGTGDVDVAGRRRDRERPHLVVVAAAEVGGLLERGETGVQPRDETLDAAAAKSGLRSAAGAGKVGGDCDTGHVDFAGRRDRERERRATPPPPAAPP